MAESINILISTVGTSLLNHWKDFVADKTTKEAIQLVKQLKSLPGGDKKLGAEICSITSLLKEEKVSEGDRLYLCVSDTSEGLFIGDVLCRYYKSIFDVEIIQIEGLQGENPKQFQAGLRTLVKNIANIKRQYLYARIAINATGGYKAQIAFATLIGQVFSIPVYYQFETFSSHIVLPPLPVSWDFDRWLEYYELLEDIDTGIDNEFLKCEDSRYQKLPPDMRVLFEEDGEDVVLSALGMLFHEGFKERFWLQAERILPPDCGIPASKKKIIYEDKNAGKHPGLQQFLEKIREVPYVTRIYTWHHDPDLIKPIQFRRSTREIDRVEGWYSDGKATTKFNVYITQGVTGSQLQAVVVDLNQRFGQR